ncbi:uncharacterized protein TM35_000073840 [Trypanosoma theileri]|uniref:Uncharacterized protein n=1 Tax=Trypanosoma theileri TaxID=67003 RepID=A0A1X0P3G8_9TRYP|nr:uncharacterized protein TM35_000073840 [Trypanosoma theileri]ORC90960.1 hypothetical protein TM35_000073840 [Trypanosoma theileri]
MHQMYASMELLWPFTVAQYKGGAHLHFPFLAVSIIALLFLVSNTTTTITVTITTVAVTTTSVGPGNNGSPDLFFSSFWSFSRHINISFCFYSSFFSLFLQAKRKKKKKNALEIN